MKNLLLVLSLCLIQNISFAQKTILDVLILGIETGGEYFLYKDPVTREKANFIKTRVGPYLGIHLSENVVFGAKGEFKSITSSLASPNQLYGFGGFLRYYLPSKAVKGRMSFLGELEYARINYHPPTFEMRTNATLNNNALRGKLGVNFRLFKRFPFYVNALFVVRAYFNKKKSVSMTSIGTMLGFEYQFGRGNEVYVKKEKDKAPYPKARLKFAQRIIIGSSLTYVWDGNNNPDEANGYNEYTWNKNMAINLNHLFYVGLSYQNIYTQGSAYTLSEAKNNYYMAGIFGQIDFQQRRKHRVFAELSFNVGNYCTCGDEDPYNEPRLYYIGLGGGGDIPIGKFLSLDLSFIVYHPINKQVEEKSSINHYTVGLNFDLIRNM